jgi:hypothetical protein
MSRGHVDLEIRGHGRLLSKVRAEFGPFLDADMEISEASESAAIRLHVPKLDPGAAVEPQRDAILQGLDAAKRLLRLQARVSEGPGVPAGRRHGKTVTTRVRARR